MARWVLCKHMAAQDLAARQEREGIGCSGLRHSSQGKSASQLSGSPCHCRRGCESKLPISDGARWSLRRCATQRPCTARQPVFAVSVSPLTPLHRCQKACRTLLGGPWRPAYPNNGTVIPSCLSNTCVPSDRITSLSTQG